LSTSLFQIAFVGVGAAIALGVTLVCFRTIGLFDATFAFAIGVLDTTRATFALTTVTFACAFENSAFASFDTTALFAQTTSVFFDLCFSGQAKHQQASQQRQPSQPSNTSRHAFFSVSEQGSDLRGTSGL
jgi:hypothetical protein